MRPAPQDTVDALARLARGEMAALTTYASAIQKFSAQPEEATLRRIHGEHQAAHARLVDLMADRGAPAPEELGAFGHVAWAVHQLTAWINDELPIQVLQRGERIGITAYERALEDPALAELRVALRAHLDTCHRHVAMLQSLRDHVLEPERPML